MLNAEFMLPSRLSVLRHSSTIVLKKNSYKLTHFFIAIDKHYWQPMEIITVFQLYFAIAYLYANEVFKWLKLR
jgi:hypothetical protein